MKITSLLLRMLSAGAMALAATTAAHGQGITFDNVVPAFPQSEISNCFSFEPTFVVGQGQCANDFRADGFTFAVQGGEGTGSLVATRVVPPLPENASTYMAFRSVSVDVDLTLRRDDGASFALRSFDLAESSIQQTWLQYELLVTGTRADGSTVSQTVLFDRSFDGAGVLADFQNVTLSAAFADVVAVGFRVGDVDPGCALECYTSRDFFIDNLATQAAPVGAVPEPGTTALMLLPLGVMVVVARRRTRRDARALAAAAR